MSGPFRLCRVETMAGHAGPGEPRRFSTEGRWWTVDSIDDRWYEGGTEPETEMVLYFRVTAEGRPFLLRFLPYFQRWQALAVEEE